MASTPFKSPYQRQIALWVLRGLSPGLARSYFFRKLDYTDADIARFLGLPETPDKETFATIPRKLDAMLATLESASHSASLPALVLENFAQLARIFRFNPTELGILRYLACAMIEPVLIDTNNLASRCIVSDPARFFSKVLGLPRHAVAEALAPRGTLEGCGLLCPRGKNSDGYEFASKSVALQLFHKTFDPGVVLRQFGAIAPPPVLGLADYPHLQAFTDLLVPYLKKSISSRNGGVNILFHGPPGTGKTQLARVLGREIGVPVFELAAENSDGDPIPAMIRLYSLRASETIFGNTKTLFVFDEAEDVFGSASALERSAVQAHKGWFNRMLEKNRLPILWISNSIDSLDPAFARRFDFIVEVPIPPKKQRRKMIGDLVGKVLTPALIDRLAESGHLAPAVIVRTHHVVRSIGKALPAAKRDAAFCQLVVSTLKAQGHPDPTKATIQAVQPGLYDIGHLNTPADLPRIAAQLKQNPSARLCLYGPPGTGKTSFGHWLAGEISQPLHVKKASDLFSPYVGITEQKIARTFELAVQEGAVLLIDEVDSFLQDRARAKHSWEITQINEMLTQIESFPGILIASTNLIDQLDPASLRRFDIKIHFDYLQPEQAARLFVSHCHHLGLPLPMSADLALAAAMHVATPGDFAAVARQHRFQPFRDAGGFLQAVTRELEHKGVHLRRIGFQ